MPTRTRAVQRAGNGTQSLLIPEASGHPAGVPAATALRDRHEPELSSHSNLLSEWLSPLASARLRRGTRVMFHYHLGDRATHGVNHAAGGTDVQSCGQRTNRPNRLLKRGRELQKRVGYLRPALHHTRIPVLFRVCFYAENGQLRV